MFKYSFVLPTGFSELEIVDIQLYCFLKDIVLSLRKITQLKRFL